MSVSERPRKPALQRRTAAVAATLALASGTLALGATAASASVSAPASGSAAVSHANGVWAMTVTGRKVWVPKPTFVHTPVHPEKITHPLLDNMGTIGAAHLKTGHPVLPHAAITSGIDISAYQGNINWANVAPYVGFVYAKATEGTYYTNPDFYNQYEGPYNYGVIRGAYHFANPSNSQGNTQADYFSSHGGGWSGDGLTLPGALDIEYNPYGSECYGLTQSQMVNWIWNFVNEYAYRWHAYPVIYSTTDWWTTCTGNYGGFGAYDPLWIANYSASNGGPLPNGWSVYSFWQYSDSGSLPGDQDVWNGSYSRLQVLADNG
ncbi:MAG TPA: GH25 family lysozyme [Streptosporangiaceae bacterium]|nr:GH25 family lysozyme [Streptosporangiaceae bacterium]